MWVPSTPELTEELARLFVRRKTTRIAVETSPAWRGLGTAELLEPAVQKEYWDQRIAGHFDGAATCVPDDQGLTA